MVKTAPVPIVADKPTPELKMRMVEFLFREYGGDYLAEAMVKTDSDKATA